MNRCRLSFLIWLISLLASESVLADTNKIQETPTSVGISVTNRPPHPATWKQLQTEYRSAQADYEKLLQTHPAVCTAREDADRAEQEVRAIILQERADTDQQLALLKTNLDDYVAAYLATNADYLKLKSETNKLSRVIWTNDDVNRRKDLQESVGRLKAQTTRSAAEEEYLRTAREELVVLARRNDAWLREKLRAPSELVALEQKAKQRPEYIELGRQYMKLQMELWDRLHDSEKVKAAQRNARDTQENYEKLVALHPELLEAKRRADEAERAYKALPWAKDKREETAQ